MPRARPSSIRMLQACPCAQAPGSALPGRRQQKVLKSMHRLPRTLPLTGITRVFAWGGPALGSAAQRERAAAAHWSVPELKQLQLSG